MNKLVINVDSDGVVYDYNTAMTQLCEGYLERALEYAPDTWSMYDAWGISKQDWFTLFERAILEGLVFSAGQQIPGAITGLEVLLERGFHVRIVTSKRLGGIAGARKSTEAQMQTLDWYGKFRLADQMDMVFTAGRFKNNYPADVVIDDKPDLRWMQEGTVNLLFSQPWNQHVETDGITLYRVDDWAEVLDMVDAVSDGHGG